MLALPQSSVAVKITVVIPEAPQSSLRLVWLFVHVTSLHTSDALAPPLLSNHACNCAMLPAPSHSTVSSDASISILGFVVSIIVIFLFLTIAFPQSSVIVKATPTVPVAPHKLLKSPTI